MSSYNAPLNKMQSGPVTYDDVFQSFPRPSMLHLG